MPKAFDGTRLAASRPHIVAADANVLINLIHVGRLDLLGRLRGHEFVVPDEVRDEITDAVQRVVLDEALDRSVVTVAHIMDVEALSLFATLRTRLGKGESACLALADHHGWSVASDEKGRFRREAERHIGSARILGTADIFLLAIRGGCLTVAEADAAKVVLEARRFRMPFTSFQELVSETDGL